MAAVIIPIAIHFWNIKEGRAFPVGSISLLEKSIKKYTRTVRIAEWLLLLLRCLLIILLAMLLAKPVKRQSFNNRQGWVLIDKHDGSIIYNHFKTTIDSLLNKGFELHELDEGFRQTSLKDILNSRDTIARAESYWQLIKKVNNKLPASFPVYVFTSNRLNEFSGERPQVNINVKWFAYTPDTTTRQLVKAWRDNERNIHVMLSNSSASGNTFSYDDVPLDKTGNNAYKISSVNGKLLIAYNNETPVIVDTTVTHISIYAGGYKQDASYASASLNAIKAFTKQPIQIAIFDKKTALPQKINWLFWLSDEMIPENITAENIFRYVKGKEVDESSFMNINYVTSAPITVNRIIKADSLQDSIRQIWQDGFGNPLLTSETNHHTNIYSFYSHLNPQWNNLVWSDAFPSILLHLLLDDEMTGINKLYADERVIDVKQMQPAFAAGSNRDIALEFEDLSTVFWFIIFLLFCTERIISFKTKTGAAA